MAAFPLSAAQIESAVQKTARLVRALTRLSSAEAENIARTAVGLVWEECHTGKVTLANKYSLQERVDRKGYWLARREVSSKSRVLSFDADSTGGGPDKSIRYARAEPPRQIEIRYLNEVVAGIMLLPKKQRDVALLLCDGLNVGDIALRLRLPLHICIARIRDARRMLWWHGLVDVATVGSGVPS